MQICKYTNTCKEIKYGGVQRSMSIENAIYGRAAACSVSVRSLFSLPALTHCAFYRLLRLAISASLPLPRVYLPSSPTACLALPVYVGLSVRIVRVAFVPCYAFVCPRKGNWPL